MIESYRDRWATGLFGVSVGGRKDTEHSLRDVGDLDLERYGDLDL
jgi:hypothetical protein